MGKILSDAETGRYRDDGYVCPIAVLSPDEVRHFRGKLEKAEANAGGSLPGPHRHNRTSSTPGRRS